MDKIKDVCAKLEHIDPNLIGTFVELSKLDRKDSEKLGDRVFSITDPFQKMCGLENDWPNGRAIFFNDDLSFVIKVN